MAKLSMTALARQWLAYADTDRRTCLQIVGTLGLEGVVAFHAQQTVEKSLKAVLVVHGQVPPRIHDLVRLYAIAIEYEQDIPQDDTLVARLSQYYTQTRYPHGVETAGPTVPDRAGLDAMIDFAGRIYTYVRNLVG